MFNFSVHRSCEWISGCCKKYLVQPWLKPLKPSSSSCICWIPGIHRSSNSYRRLYWALMGSNCFLHCYLGKQSWKRIILYTTTVEFKSICQSHVTEGMCRNMVAVTHHKGVLMKGLNCDNNQIWQFWPKIRLSASKWQIFAPAAGTPLCIWGQSPPKCIVQHWFNSHNSQNVVLVTASKTRWRKQNFVRCVTVTEGCRFDLNSTVWFPLVLCLPIVLSSRFCYCT